MKDGGSFEQCYNAQAAVEVETMLVVGEHVSDAPNDKQQLEPTLASVSPVAGKVAQGAGRQRVLQRGGRHHGGGRRQGPTVYAAMKRQRHGRSVEQLEKRDDPPPPPPGAAVAEVMAHRLETKAGKELYGLRKQTVEPVFGIIKEALGFRRFLMRGLEKVEPRMDPGDHQLQPQTDVRDENAQRGRVKGATGRVRPRRRGQNLKKSCRNAKGSEIGGASRAGP